MATHSSILAWEIPCTEELGELQSMGSQRVGQTEHTPHYLALPSTGRWYEDGPQLTVPSGVLLVGSRWLGHLGGGPS